MSTLAKHKLITLAMFTTLLVFILVCRSIGQTQYQVTGVTKNKKAKKVFGCITIRKDSVIQFYCSGEKNVSFKYIKKIRYHRNDHYRLHEDTPETFYTGWFIVYNETNKRGYLTYSIGPMCYYSRWYSIK